MPSLYDAKPIGIRLRQKDRDTIHQAAEIAQERPSDFARRAALARARRILENVGRDNRQPTPGQDTVLS
jgi:uncharacterized protein (DUF1778 family)